MVSRFFNIWWRRRGSNSLPLECHSSALPSELRPQVVPLIFHQRLLLYHRIFVLSIVFEQFFEKFSVYQLAHDDKSLVLTEAFIIARAGGEGYQLVAAGDTYAEIEKAQVHGFLCHRNNVNVVAVDIEAEVGGERHGKNPEGVHAAVGGEIDVLVFGDEILIGKGHEGFKLAACFLERNETVVPVVAIDYGVLGKLTASEVCGFCGPGHAAGLVVGSGG